MKILLIFILFMAFCSTAFGQNCIENAKIVPPVISENARKVYLEKLAEAVENHQTNPNNADNLIWLGRRTAYLGNYKEAIKIFTEGIEKFPQDARFYRHRGHRFITIRCFDEAIKDFELAAKLTKGKKDEIEPDGLPNARNIPTSTLQSNIFYHLGLAYYVKGDFKRALKAYKNCEKVSKNPDMLVATKHWLYMTLRRLGKKTEAEKSIADVKDNLEIIENDDYYKLIKLYQGKLKAEDLTMQDANSLGNASLGYGVGNWFLYNGETEKALKVFRQITSGNQWASFGFIAAEAEQKRICQSAIFWMELEKLCGKAFEGTVINAPADDTTFKGKKLVMHVRTCEKDRIRIPFFVGEDKSRTWVLTRQNDRILLKHDHRHEDGKPDAVTMYGGLTTNEGSATRQMFPADQETVKVIAAAASNVWWIDLMPNEFFSYNLRRMGTDRFFSIKFDLKKEIPAPSAPWGWKD
jgi:tetratricopeptide (TPR) repeat protein